MSYQVQVGSGGYLGWKILERNAATQRAAFEKSTQIRLSVDYFAEKMPSVKQADELVSDYKLLSVTLRAFGLDNDIGNRLFIKKVLEADPNDSSSLVNKLSDKRYLTMNTSLGMGGPPAADGDTSSVQSIIDLYKTRSFEKNIGQQYQEIEIAMNARREIPGLASAETTENTKWYHILGSRPLRKVFEGAFGLSASFGQLPMDRQLSEMKLRLERMSGSSDISQLSDPEMLDKLIKHYLIKTQASSSISTPYSAALTILRQGQ